MQLADLRFYFAIFKKMDLNNSPKNLLPSVSSHTGAVLLDVENFPLKLNLAQYLKAYCKYNITLKFAVANWQNSSISQLDKYLHQQGYQLIHVPKAQNAADAQILTLGASLQLHYPQVKDVVIVSRDSIFNYLHQTLQRQGCNTYKVYQQSGNVYLDDFISDRPSIITKVSDLDQKQHNEQKQNPEQTIKSKIKQTLIELAPQPNQQITFNQLCQGFKDKHKKSMSDVLKSHKLSSTPLNFVKKSCADKINVQTKNKTHYLSIIDS